MALGGSDANLNIVVRLKDEASKQFDALKTKIEGVSKGMQPAVDVSQKFALALGGAGVAAAGFGVMAVKAAMGAQVEMAKFNATMKTIPGVTQAATDAILKRAKAVTKMGFDDEEAANTMAKLYQRTGDVNKAMELNSLAMDLARAKGVSLSEAGNMIGLVMSGAGRALKQYGIEIDETLGPMAALEQLQGKVQGHAEAFSGTLAGQGEALKVAWGNFMETVGEKLIPIVVALLKEITPVVEKFNEWIGETQNLVNWLKEHQAILITIAGAVVGLLVPAMISFSITLFTTVIPALIAMAIAAAPWLIGGAIIGGLVAGIIWLVKNWEMVKDKMKIVWEGIKSYFKEGINFLIGLAEGWANSYVKAANTIIAGLNKIQITVPDWVPKIGGKSFGVNIASVPEVKLPRLEHGGMVQGARGEAVPIIAHGGETIIPAGRNSQKTGTTVNITITNPQVRNDRDLTEITKQIEKVFRDVTRVHKLSTI